VHEKCFKKSCVKISFILEEFVFPLEKLLLVLVFFTRSYSHFLALHMSYLVILKVHSLVGHYKFHMLEYSNPPKDILIKGFGKIEQAIRNALNTLTPCLWNPKMANYIIQLKQLTKRVCPIL